MKGKTTPVIIGTRGSELALWQANYTKSVLEKNGYKAELKIIKTKGDATQQWNLSFDKIEGKGFFTKELEDALLFNEIDVAVHSCKDLPTESPEGLTITAYSKRANPFDILLIRKESVDNTGLLKLKPNAIVGSSSARRKAQILALRPDVLMEDLRGNVPTRIERLANKQYDAIILASAGVERLNIDLSRFEQYPLIAPMFIPAPAQGVLAFQIRQKDEEMQNICAILGDANTTALATIEREILHVFEGGCQMPLGVYAEKIKDDTHVWISQATAWNTFPKRKHYVFTKEDTKQVSSTIIRLVNDFKTSNQNAVFISSDLSNTDYLARALRDLNYKIEFESYITFVPLDFENPTDADWLFFSSKNGVKHYFKKVKKILPNIKIAAVNSGTAQILHELGAHVDFIGSGGDIQNIAHEFDKVAFGKIYFPQAKKSLQSIQKALKINKDIHTLVVYDNQAKQQVQKRTDSVLVFTSPLSAEAYFANNELEKNQKVISIGPSTTRKLTALGIVDVKTAFEPTHWAMLDEIF